MAFPALGGLSIAFMGAYNVNHARSIVRLSAVLCMSQRGQCLRTLAHAGRPRDVTSWVPPAPYDTVRGQRCNAELVLGEHVQTHPGFK